MIVYAIKHIKEVLTLFYSPAPTPKYERCEGKTDLIT